MWARAAIGQIMAIGPPSTSWPSTSVQANCRVRAYRALLRATVHHRAVVVTTAAPRDKAGPARTSACTSRTALELTAVYAGPLSRKRPCAARQLITEAHCCTQAVIHCPTAFPQQAADQNTARPAAQLGAPPIGGPAGYCCLVTTQWQDRTVQTLARATQTQGPLLRFIDRGVSVTSMHLGLLSAGTAAADLSRRAHTTVLVMAETTDRHEPLAAVDLPIYASACGHAATTVSCLEYV